MSTNIATATLKSQQEPIKVIESGNIRQTGYSFLLVFYSKFVFEIFVFKYAVTLKTGLGGSSRSLKMAPFDRAHMTSYIGSIATMALPSVVSEIFNVEKY